MLLDSVVRQVHKGLVDVLLVERESVTASTNVTFSEKVAFLVLQVTAVDEHPETNVKLSTID